MAEIGNKAAFVSKVTNHEVFKKFLVPDVSAKETLFPPQKVVVRNGDVFYASQSVVRCCSLFDESNMFRLLDYVSPFAIESMHINSQGRLLALLGERAVSVVSLPTSLETSQQASEEKVPVTASYSLGDLDSKIVKVIWQSVSANESTLVVLTEKSEIKAYDLSLSLSFPQLVIDLKQYAQFKDATATSISFGSNITLAGSITLYVTSSSGEVFAIYPFLTPKAKLVTSPALVSEAIQESRNIIEAIESKVPADQRTASASPVFENAIAQHAFYSHILSQLSSGVPLVSEYRSWSIDKYDLKRVPNISISKKPTLQGPLFKAGSASLNDIGIIHSTPEVTVLSTISTSKDKSTSLNFHSQLTPLLMKWESPEIKRIEPLKPSTPVSTPSPKTSGYTKLKKGFGYVDLSDSEGDDESTAMSTQLVKTESTGNIDTVKIIEQFEAKELKHISTLKVDILPIAAPPVSGRLDAAILATSQELDSFLVCINNKLVLCDISEWIKAFNKDLSSLEPTSQHQHIAPKYQLIASDQVASACYISDALTNTGEYVITISDNKKNNLSLTQIAKGLTDVLKVDRKQTTKPSTAEFKSKFPKQSIDEISVEAKAVSSFDANKLTSKFGEIKEASPTSIKTLQDVNELSNTTMDQVSAISQLTLKMYYKVASQVEQLHFSIESLKSVANSDLSLEVLAKTLERVEKVIQVQDNLEKRVLKVKSTLYDYSRKIISSQELPLSKAEKAWFKEINYIIKTVNVDDDDKSSISTRLEKYQSQVKSLIAGVHESAKTTESTIADVKQKELEKQLMGLRIQLQDQNRLVHRMKSRMNSLANA